MTTATNDLQPGWDDVHVAHPPRPFVETGLGSPSAVLLAVPHSGRAYPPELLESARLSLREIRRLEDPLVDALIGRASAAGTGTITAAYARAWIDLNRRETEIDSARIRPRPAAHIDQRSPRVMAGLGLVPQKVGAGRPIYDTPLAQDDIAKRIAGIHRPYHDRISERLLQSRDRHGIALFCDIHSMPALPASQAADIVIGDRHGRSAAPWVVESITEWLLRKGYRVARNLPYAGGYGVERHGQPGNSVHAVQIEIDRGLYLDETGFALGGGADAITRMIEELAARLTHELQDRSSQRLAAE